MLTYNERAAFLGRVLVANDEDDEVTAHQPYRQDGSFPGVVAWRQKTYSRMTASEIGRGIRRDSGGWHRTSLSLLGPPTSDVVEQTRCFETHS